MASRNLRRRRSFRRGKNLQGGDPEPLGNMDLDLTQQAGPTESLLLQSQGLFQLLGGGQKLFIFPLQLLQRQGCFLQPLRFLHQAVPSLGRLPETVNSGESQKGYRSTRSKHQGGKILLFLGLSPAHGSQHIDPHRGIRRRLQGCSNRHGPSRKISGCSLRLRCGRQAQTAERLEKFHGNSELFPEKKIGVPQHGTAAGQPGVGWLPPALLTAKKGYGPFHFGVQAGHDAPRQF